VSAFLKGKTPVPSHFSCFSEVNSRFSFFGSCFSIRCEVVLLKRLRTVVFLLIFGTGKAFLGYARGTDPSFACQVQTLSTLLSLFLFARQRHLCALLMIGYLLFPMLGISFFHDPPRRPLFFLPTALFRGGVFLFTEKSSFFFQQSKYLFYTISSSLSGFGQPYLWSRPPNNQTLRNYHKLDHSFFLYVTERSVSSLWCPQQVV